MPVHVRTRSARATRLSLASPASTKRAAAALFGPVFAAAVMLSTRIAPIRGLHDSKQLDAERREVLAARIRERAVAWAVAAADAAEIDRINIFRPPAWPCAAPSSGSDAAAGLTCWSTPSRWTCRCRSGPLIQGDARSPVDRRRLDPGQGGPGRLHACDWDAVFPEYGLARQQRATARRSIWRRLRAIRPDAAAPLQLRAASATAVPGRLRSRRRAVRRGGGRMPPDSLIPPRPNAA